MTTPLSTAPADSPDLTGFDAINKVGDPIGAIGAQWRNQLTGRLEFIGVKTGWFSGALHAIPAIGLKTDAARGRVVLPYTSGQVENAPSFDADAILTDAGKAAVYGYYGIQNRSGVVPEGVDSGTTTHRAGPHLPDPTNPDATDFTAGTGKGGYEDTTAPAK